MNLLCGCVVPGVAVSVQVFLQFGRFGESAVSSTGPGSCAVRLLCEFKIGSLMCFPCKTLFSDVVVVCLVPDYAICGISEHALSNFCFIIFFSKAPLNEYT